MAKAYNGDIRIETDGEKVTKIYLDGENGTEIELPSAPFVLPVATSDKLGGVKPGADLAVAEDGTLSLAGVKLPELPEDIDIKDYALQIVGGALVWTEIVE